MVLLVLNELRRQFCAKILKNGTMENVMELEMTDLNILRANYTNQTGKDELGCHVQKMRLSSDNVNKRKNLMTM